MKKHFKFLRRFFINYIFPFFVILSIYSIPFIFLSVLGVFYLLQSNHWLLFFTSVFLSFGIVFFLILFFRFFRLPHFTTPDQQTEARKQADDFIDTFDYNSLQFYNHKATLDAIFDLNCRIARAFGVRSAHPELDVPVGFFLQSLESISSDLYVFCSRIKFFNIEPLDFIKLSFFLRFVPSSSSKTDTPSLPVDPEVIPEEVEASTTAEVEDSETENHSSIFSFLDPLPFFRRLIFKRLFKIVADKSIQLYSGKVLSEHRHLSFRDFSPIRKFFSTRLLIWPIVWGIFVSVFMTGLVVCGILYSRDSVCELIHFYRNCKANGLVSFSTLPWGQIFFRLLPGILALTFSCFFYLIPFFCRFRLSPFKVEPLPEWPEREMENFNKSKEFINSLDVSRLRDFSSFAEVIYELVSFMDSCYRKPETAAFSLSLSEILKSQQILISRLQTKFNEEFPFINYLTIRDFLFVNRLYNLYTKFFLVFRGFNCFVNPLSGTVTEMRIRLNRSLLHSLLDEFLISGNIFLLDVINFHLVEVYSGQLHFPEKGLPLAFFLTGGNDQLRHSVCSALLNIPDLNLEIQMESRRKSFNFRNWLPFLNSSKLQKKKTEEQIRQSDVVLLLDPKKSGPGKMCDFQLDSSEKPPLTVVVFPVSQSPLPCSEDFCSVPWQSDDESVFQESLQSLLKRNQQKIRSRQVFRFLRSYREKHDR